MGLFKKIILLTSICLFSFSSIAMSMNKKCVYLTFDDGPTLKNTPMLLDTLKNLELPATFFVVGKLIDENPEVLKRIAEENHSIGLHTMSHNKNKCYASQDSFIKENLELQKILKEKFNISTNILRFPFGSQNFYLRMDKNFVDKLHRNCFKVYDWHIDTFDAVKPNNTPETILGICKKQFEARFKDNENIIILMHTNSNNINTINSIKLIKEYFTKMGYEFKKITDETPELFNIKQK